MSIQKYEFLLVARYCYMNKAFHRGLWCFSAADRKFTFIYLFHILLRLWHQLLSTAFSSLTNPVALYTTRYVLGFTFLFFLEFLQTQSFCLKNLQSLQDYGSAGRMDTNDSLRLASLWHSMHAISQQLSPTPGCNGIDLLQAHNFDLHCFQSLTGM